MSMTEKSPKDIMVFVVFFSHNIEEGVKDSVNVTYLENLLKYLNNNERTS